MSRKKASPSQVMELFLTVAEELGFTSDLDIAALADVGPESVVNWRGGAVKEFKNQKFQAALASLRGQIRALTAQAGLSSLSDDGKLSPVEIERGSSPAELHRQFRDQVGYDYLGHRFLYFEPQGALAWERLIKVGYEQDCWIDGVAECCDVFLDTTTGGTDGNRGGLARLLGIGRKDRANNIEIVSLGPGEGDKEIRILDKISEVLGKNRSKAGYLSYVPVDVSIALLLRAARGARDLFAENRAGLSRSRLSVLPVCADFEEGGLAFRTRLRSSTEGEGENRRLVLFLGNVLGNVRDEETFVRRKLHQLLRPGDMLWVEVGLRSTRPDMDPLFQLTLPDREETAGEANRRLLLEGPYRRYLVASGRAAGELDLRIRVQEGGASSRIPGSYNFCHDLIIPNESRAVTMLYSRRYDLEKLGHWFEDLGFSLEGIRRTKDMSGRSRVGHLLLHYKGARK